MKNILKVWLRKNIWSRIPNDFKAEVVNDTEIEVADIVDRLLQDGLCVEKECALQFVELFNQKVAELTLSGYKVDTGLMTLNAEIKSPIINKKWNNEYNSIQIACNPSETFEKEISNTTIEILGEKVDSTEIVSTIEYNKKEETDYRSANRVVLNSNGDVPACGMAFRTWLFKS